MRRRVGKRNNGPPENRSASVASSQSSGAEFSRAAMNIAKPLGEKKTGMKSVGEALCKILEIDDEKKEEYIEHMMPAMFITAATTIQVTKKSQEEGTTVTTTVKTGLGGDKEQKDFLEYLKVYTLEDPTEMQKGNRYNQGDRAVRAGDEKDLKLQKVQALQAVLVIAMRDEDKISAIEEATNKGTGFSNAKMKQYFPEGEVSSEYKRIKAKYISSKGSEARKDKLETFVRTVMGDNWVDQGGLRRGYVNADRLSVLINGSDVQAKKAISEYVNTLESKDMQLALCTYERSHLSNYRENTTVFQKGNDKTELKSVNHGAVGMPDLRNNAGKFGKIKLKLAGVQHTIGSMMLGDDYTNHIDYYTKHGLFGFGENSLAKDGIDRATKILSSRLKDAADQALKDGKDKLLFLDHRFLGEVAGDLESLGPNIQRIALERAKGELKKYVSEKKDPKFPESFMENSEIHSHNTNVVTGKNLAGIDEKCAVLERVMLVQKNPTGENFNKFFPGGIDSMQYQMFQAASEEYNSLQGEKRDINEGKNIEVEKSALMNIMLECAGFTLSAGCKSALDRAGAEYATREAFKDLYWQTKSMSIEGQENESIFVNAFIQNYTLISERINLENRGFLGTKTVERFMPRAVLKGLTKTGTTERSNKTQIELETEITEWRSELEEIVEGREVQLDTRIESVESASLNVAALESKIKANGQELMRIAVAADAFSAEDLTNPPIAKFYKKCKEGLKKGVDQADAFRSQKLNAIVGAGRSFRHIANFNLFRVSEFRRKFKEGRTSDAFRELRSGCADLVILAAAFTIVPAAALVFAAFTFAGAAIFAVPEVLIYLAQEGFGGLKNMGVNLMTKVFGLNENFIKERISIIVERFMPPAVIKLPEQLSTVANVISEKRKKLVGLFKYCGLAAIGSPIVALGVTVIAGVNSIRQANKLLKYIAEKINGYVSKLSPSQAPKLKTLGKGRQMPQKSDKKPPHTVKANHVGGRPEGRETTSAAKSLKQGGELISRQGETAAEELTSIRERSLSSNSQTNKQPEQGRGRRKTI